MHIPVQSLFAIAALASVVSAGSIHKDESHHNAPKAHKAHKAPKGKAFDHFIQIWFENMVNITWREGGGDAEILNHFT
jgi:hypothetical protein